MFGTPYSMGKLATGVLVSAVAFVLASTVVGAGLGLLATTAGLSGAAVGTGIQILSFASGLLGSMAGFQGGLKLHDKIDDIRFNMKNKRQHTAIRPGVSIKKQSFGQKLSNIFKRSKKPKAELKAGEISINRKNDNRPKR